MAKQLDTKLAGLVLAVVLGLGAAVSLPGAANAAGPDIIGVDVPVVGTGDVPLIDSTVGTVNDAVEPVVSPVVDPVVDLCANVAGDVTAQSGDSCGGGSGPLEPVTDAVNPVIDPVLDLCTTAAGVSAQAGAGCGSGTPAPTPTTTDPVTNVVDAVTGTLDAGSTDGTTSTVADVVSSVSEVPVGDSTVGGSADGAADAAVDVADPAIDPAIDLCADVPPAGVSVDVGSSCGGGSGILDPITTAVDPIVEPLADVCTSVGGVDAGAGTTCAGSGGGTSDLLDPLVGDLALPGTPSIDTQPIGDTEQQIVNPLDVCANVDPVNLNEELGAGCDQPEAPCTALNVNCLATDLTDPLLGPGGALDPVADACLGYDPLGFNLDIGSACAAATPPPPATCPPDCGATCPPDCGPPVCMLFCGPVPNPPTCPPLCVQPPSPYGFPTVTGGLAGSGALGFIGPSNSGDGNTAYGGFFVSFTGTGPGIHAPAIKGPSSSQLPGILARPPASPLSGQAGAIFGPPDAGDGGLLGRGWGDNARPLDPAVFLFCLVTTALVLRRRAVRLS